MITTFVWVLVVSVSAHSSLDFSHLGLLPKWEPTYSMPLSTFVMPCNYSGYFDSKLTTKFGMVDFDWSNAKNDWANQKPMDCEERLVEQAALVKEVNPNTKVWIYRNLVKALPWFTHVRERLQDPQYAGWFLKFKPQGPYHVPKCDNNYDPPRCSDFYHDQDQTPGHPKGDGSCVDACDCGENVPCGEYLWDHRNASLRDYLINEFVLGKTGLANANVSGFYFDDGWANKSQPIAPWQPKEGFCDHWKTGGATEENLYCSQDMGLTQADTTAIRQGWEATMEAVFKAVVENGGFSFQLFSNAGTPPQATCAEWFRKTGTQYASRATFLQFTGAKTAPLPQPNEDLATFLLIRGDYAWIGYGWVGCKLEYDFPDQLNADYGKPLTTTYKETSQGVFSREYSKASVSFDCNKYVGTITPK